MSLRDVIEAIRELETEMNSIYVSLNSMTSQQVRQYYNFLLNLETVRGL